MRNTRWNIKLHPNYKNTEEWDAFYEAYSSGSLSIETPTDDKFKAIYANQTLTKEERLWFGNQIVRYKRVKN